MKHLYEGVIRSVCRKDYSDAQTAVWASSVKNEARWAELVAQQYVVLAESAEGLAGFASLKDGWYVDFFYVHRDWQGRGVARFLMDLLLAEANRQGTMLLSSDVSITACPFFRRHGFKVIATQENVRQDQVLVNYKMIRHLPGPELNPDLKGVMMIQDASETGETGLVITGQLVVGLVDIGDHITFWEQGKRTYVVGSRQFGVFSEPATTGLILRHLRHADEEYLKSWKPFNVIALVSEATL